MTAATKVKYGQVDDTIVASNLYRQALINPGGDTLVTNCPALSAMAGSTWANHKTYYGVDRWLGYTSGTVSGGYFMQPNGNYINCIKNNSNGTVKISIMQILEAKNSYTFRGKYLSFRMTPKTYTVSSTPNFAATIFVLAMKTGGTADTITNAPISAFNSDGVRASFDTTNYTVLYEGDVTADNTEKSGTTSIVMPTDAKNLIFGVVMKSTTANTGVYDGIEITNCLLCAGSVALPFMPKSYDEELRACQRYCWRPVSGASDNYTRVGAYSSNAMYFTIYAPVALRTTATISGTESTDWTITNTIGVATTGFTLSTNSPGGSSINVIATKTSHGLTEGSFRTINTGLIFSAEL